MNIRVARRIAAGLPFASSITHVEFLRKGYSTDRKYILWTGDQARYLLRLSDISETDRRRREFDLLAELHGKGIACSEAISFGTAESDGVCFSVLGFMPGESARTAIPKLPKDRQYAVGLEAGQVLARMHQALPPPEIDWVKIRTEKYFSNKAYCRENGLTFPQQSDIERLIEENLHLLQDRPTAFLHGDYHPGNMIVSEGEFAGVIDFNLCRWGDPCFEFYKVAMFGAPLSEPFARGQIHGYFEGDAPAEFWRMYNLYVAMVLNADLVWTSQHYPYHLHRSYPLIQQIIRTHDLSGGGPPGWLSGDIAG